MYKCKCKKKSRDLSVWQISTRLEMSSSWIESSVGLCPLCHGGLGPIKGNKCDILAMVFVQLQNPS